MLTCTPLSGPLGAATAEDAAQPATSTETDRAFIESECQNVTGDNCRDLEKLKEWDADVVGCCLLRAYAANDVAMARAALGTHPEVRQFAIAVLRKNYPEMTTFLDQVEGKPAPKKGLSKGVKIGLGVGAGLTVLGIAAFALSR